MSVKIAKEDIKQFECKHAVYIKSEDYSQEDLVAVKEYIYTNDGRKIPNLRLFKNFRREFWVTRENYRNHSDKKEWEDVSRLKRYETTQGQLTSNVARALGRPGFKGSLKMLARSQYLYGCDITTPAIIKHNYMKKYPDAISPNSVAVLDIETDVNKGDGMEVIICVALTFKEKAIIAVTKDFLGTIINPEEKIHAAFEKYLGEYKEQRNIHLEVVVSETPGRAVQAVMKKAHEWMPDFIAIWNISFDLPRCISALEADDISISDTFTDPSVPLKFRHARFIAGPTNKRKSNGETMSLHPADQWHTMQCAASFYFIDAMAVYKRIRVAKQMETSYSLDHILDKNLGIRKLKFKEADHLSGTRWHDFMQRLYKIEYCIYNLFDCISVELLDEKNKDLALTISVLCEHSEYTRFPSQPRRTVDDLHFFCLDHGKVIATTSDMMNDENEEHVLDMNNWIVTLPAHLVEDNGLAIINELPDVRSGARAHVADLDVSGAYPNTEDFLNISKETTFRELSKIKDIPELTQRMAGINLTGGTTNAVEICCEIFKLPNFDTLLDAFNNDRLVVSNNQ